MSNTSIVPACDPQKALFPSDVIANTVIPLSFVLIVLSNTGFLAVLFQMLIAPLLRLEIVNLPFGVIAMASCSFFSVVVAVLSATGIFGLISASNLA